MNEDEKQQLNQHQSKIFFGAYAANPKMFEFTRGNIKLIKLIVERINSTIATAPNEQAGLEIWNQQTKSHWWKTLCSTPLGYFYGDIDTFDAKKINLSDRNHSNTKSATDIEQLKKGLYAKVKKVLTAHKEKLKPLGEFTENSISVSIINGFLVQGIVTCNCCPTDSHMREVKMFYQHTKCSGYWVPANYERHILKYHVIHRTNAIGKSIANTTSNIEIEPGTSSQLEMEAVFEPVEYDCEAVEDFLFVQISRQNIQLVNRTLNNDERIVDFYVAMDMDSMKPSKMIKICKIEGDGSCLFSALSHQISFLKIGSANHKNQSKDLRKDCVEHIKTNFDRYIPFLTSRVIELHEKKRIVTSNTNIINECREFLDLSLPLNTTYGGVESIKAVSELNNVNIITVTEDGSCNLVHLIDTKFERSVCIAYRNGDHYDSVAEIDTKTISDFAKKLAIDHTTLSNGERHTILVE